VSRRKDGIEKQVAELAPSKTHVRELLINVMSESRAKGKAKTALGVKFLFASKVWPQPARLPTTALEVKHAQIQGACGQRSDCSNGTIVGRGEFHESWHMPGRERMRSKIQKNSVSYVPWFRTWPYENQRGDEQMRRSLAKTTGGHLWLRQYPQIRTPILWGDRV